MLRFSMMAIALLMLASSQSPAAEYLNGIKWEEPAVVTPGKTNSDAPSDAVVLFDGKDLSKWNNGERWSVDDDGNMVTGKGKLVSKDEFGDCQLHIEWSAPTPAKGTGQGDQARLGDHGRDSSAHNRRPTFEGRAATSGKTRT